MKKTIVYFTDSRLEERLDAAVRKQILKAADGIPVISVSQKPLDFGRNICVGIKPRCYLSLYEQLLEGICAADRDSVVFVCEHDVFYHPSHFEFEPPEKDKIYYNLNRYYWKHNTGFFVKTTGKRALSQAVSYRDVILDHAKQQVLARQEGLESPCVGPFENFSSEYPNIDVRHGGNFSNCWAFKNPEDKRNRIVYSVGHWGTPMRFQDRVGYKSPNIKTRDRMHKTLNPENKPNPIELPILRRNLPGMFYFLGFKRGAEIGVKRGEYSYEICNGMPGVELKCIDPYLPGAKYGWDLVEGFVTIARKKLSGFNAEFIRKTSRHASAEDIPKWSLDFVYIDADHSFNQVMQDVIIWSDRVRPGGVVSGHDYDNPDVKAAVDTYTKIHECELFITQKGRKYPDSSPSWFFAKG